MLLRVGHQLAADDVDPELEGRELLAVSLRSRLEGAQVAAQIGHQALRRKPELLGESALFLLESGDLGFVGLEAGTAGQLRVLRLVDLCLQVGQLRGEVGAALDGAGEAPVQRSLPLPRHRTNAAQPFGKRLESGGGGCVAFEIAADGTGGGAQRIQAGAQLGEGRGVPGQCALELDLLGGRRLGTGGEGPQGLASQPQVQPDHGVSHRVVSLGGIRLALEGAEAATLLFEDVGEARDVLVGLLQATQRAVSTAPVFRDAGCLLDDGAMLIGPGAEDVADLALSDEHVLVASHAAVGQQFVQVQEPALGPVQQIFGGAVAVEAPRHRYLVEIERQEPVRVVERERHLGSTQPRASRGAGKDDIVHLLGAQRGRGLGAHHPGERVEEVGFARAVRADHDVDP
ncbi:MAG: hypothetical protein R3190_11345 [Thermoanaerobaculia bacterium]|nr:hypothetical protein [Thermoanaerobaculia bacterium]